MITAKALPLTPPLNFFTTTFANEQTLSKGRASLIWIQFCRALSFSNEDQAKRRLGPKERTPFSDKKTRQEEKFFISCCAGMEDVISSDRSFHDLVSALNPDRHGGTPEAMH